MCLGDEVGGLSDGHERKWLFYLRTCARWAPSARNPKYLGSLDGVFGNWGFDLVVAMLTDFLSAYSNISTFRRWKFFAT
jgi:hypothetical protein